MQQAERNEYLQTNPIKIPAGFYENRQADSKVYMEMQRGPRQQRI